MLLKRGYLGALQLFLCFVGSDLLEGLAVSAVMHQAGGVETGIKQVRVFLKVADAQFADIFEVALSK